MTGELDILTGQMVAQIGFDHEVWLKGERGDQLVIADDVEIVAANGTRVRYGGDSWRPHASALLTLLWASVVKSEYGESRLVLSLDDGRRVEVQANPQYEAWRYVPRTGEWLVCLPGGELG